VRHSDELMNIAERVATVLEARHGLRRFTLLVDVPGFDVAVSWADRNDDVALTRWFAEIASACTVGTHP